MSNIFDNTSTQVSEQSDSQENVDALQEQNIPSSSSESIENSPVGDFENISEDIVPQNPVQIRLDDNLRNLIRRRIDPSIGEFITKKEAGILENKLGSPCIIRQKAQYVVPDDLIPAIENDDSIELSGNFIDEEHKTGVEEKYGVVLKLRLNNSNPVTLFLAQESQNNPSKKSQSFVQRELAKASRILQIKRKKEN